jgi:hypothetical protein
LNHTLPTATYKLYNMPPRRRSVDSSSSSSSGDSSKAHKGKRDKKGMDQDSKKEHGSRSIFQGHPPEGPPPYSPPINYPPSGYRVPLSTTAPFPTPQQAGQPPCYDADGVSPVFIGSALLQSSVHPCKIAPHLQPVCRMPFGGVSNACSFLR